MKNRQTSRNRIWVKAWLALLLFFVFTAASAGTAEAAVKGSDLMLPVYGRDIKDGTYPVEVDSSSSFFKIQDAELLVDGDEMQLKFVIGSLSYQYIYPGTKKEAGKAPEEDWISRVEKDGTSVFTMPVDALDQETECAAYSIKRKRWYGRKLIVLASSLPEDVLSFELPDYDYLSDAAEYYEASGEAPAGEKKDDAQAGEGSRDPEDGGSTGEDGSGGQNTAAEEVPFDDGVYSIEVNMTGGSGRASISSPARLNVRGGRAYAVLIWSSPHYDYMILNGQKYLNEVTDGGNSRFEIPVTALDEGIPVIADTTAMGEPVEIEYMLTFYQESIGGRGLIPQEAAKRVLIIAALIIAGGGILNYILKRGRST